MKKCVLFTIVPLALLLGIPSGCQKDRFLSSPGSGPSALFDEAWHVLDERYALFAEKGINWDSVRTVYEGRFFDEMTERELFSEMSRMLESLEDGHVVLISPFDTSSYDGFFSGYPRNFNLDHVLNNYLGGNYTHLGPLLYAVRENIGYVHYPRFSAKLEDRVMDSLVAAVSGTRGLIIDVRGNQGGLLDGAESLASLLVSDPVGVKFEQFKSGTARDAFGSPVPFVIQPFRTNYREPVIILTNRSCFSACNDFVLYTTVLPNVRRYGDQTGGGGGIPSAYRLSNGWIIQFSATRTLSVQLVSVEQGIHPDKEIQITVLDDARGRDPILETAFLDLR